MGHRIAGCLWESVAFAGWGREQRRRDVDRGAPTSAAGAVGPTGVVHRQCRRRSGCPRLRARARGRYRRGSRQVTSSSPVVDAAGWAKKCTEGHFGQTTIAQLRSSSYVWAMTTSVAIYTRLSSETPGRQQTATKRQERDCRVFAQPREWDVSGVYEDVDLSAYKKGVKRPAYESLSQGH